MANVLTPQFKVAYPNVFKSRLNEKNGKQEYSVVALFPKDADFTSLKAAATAELEKKFGKDKTQWPENLKTPFRDQKEKAKFVDGKKIMPEGYTEGCIFMTLRSQQKPGVVDQNVQDIIVESDFYSGCMARATIRPYAYDNTGNRGVAFGLVNIQKVADGKPLGSRTTPEMDFAPIAGTDGEPASPKSATSLFD